MRYWLTASNGKGHGIHSPFVFNFVKNVLNDTTNFAAYEEVEALRHKLYQSKLLIEVEDMGAGSVIPGGKRRKVSHIARNAAKPARYGQLLFRIVQYFKPELILEMGTSLGVTTSYLASANKNSKVITLEGASSIAEIAEANFSDLHLTNIKLIKGHFDHSLPDVLKGPEKVDISFIDGNHRKEPTLQYFKTLGNHIKSSSILIFDDIHWSKEMEEAWEKIKADTSVTLTIDLFFIGLVFFRDEFKIKQHFTIRY
ncbi:MAG: class I SAM-dependent methyltransferase [Chitinophagaceae bacterium]